MSDNNNIDQHKDSGGGKPSRISKRFRRVIYILVIILFLAGLVLHILGDFTLTSFTLNTTVCLGIIVVLESSRIDRWFSGGRG